MHSWIGTSNARVPRLRGLRGRAGMTLTEVMIACAVMALSLGAFLSGFTTYQKCTWYANNRLDSLARVRGGLEALGSLNYYDARLTPGLHAAAAGESYTITESNDLKDIVYTREWIDPTRGVTSRLSLATSLSRAIHK